jgi:hypothetical protein
MIHCESEHERNTVRLLDFLPEVLKINEQPARIVYCLNGIEHSHVPDLLVVTKSGKEFWEIKLARGAAKDEIRIRTDFLSHQLPTQGFAYRLIIADDLGRNPRMDNVSRVLSLGRHDIPTREREFLNQLLLKMEITWAQVQAQAFGPYSAHYICRLVLEGELWFDVEQPMTPETTFAPISAHRQRR